MDGTTAQEWAEQNFGSVDLRHRRRMLGSQHLLSATAAGSAIQAYCALLASMLIRLWTGLKPTLSAFRMLYWYFLGWATQEELLAHLDKLRKRAAPKLSRC